MFGIGRVKTMKKLAKLAGQVDQLMKELNNMKTLKGFLFSKRTWVSIAGVIATVGEILPPKYAAIGTAVGVLITKLIDMATPSN